MPHLFAYLIFFFDITYAEIYFYKTVEIHVLEL